MKEFFDAVRKSFGPLTANQVKGLDALLVASMALPTRHRAYILATAWHETGPTGSPLHMTPRREIWGPTAAQKRYEGRKDLGNTQPGDGKRFMGRGYVQITGRANYAKASGVVGRDLVANPDLALEPGIAAGIIVDGMRRGWFTGKSMSDFDSYVNMRRVVNGTDRADLIAGYAEKFEDALRSVPVEQPPPPPNDEPVLRPPPDIEPPPPALDAGTGVAGALLAALAALAAYFAYWMSKG
jgi:putative chitinase